MRIIKREVYTSRYFRAGRSNVMVVPAALCEMMGLHYGDILACNFQHGVLWARKLEPGMIADRATISKIFDALFPDKDKDIECSRTSS
jgi:hypothetical protein